MSEIPMIEHYIKCVSECVSECVSKSKSEKPEIDCKKQCQNFKNTF